MTVFQKKILRFLAFLLFLTILFTLGVLTYIGFFSKARIELAEKGPYTIVCLSNTGPYYKTIKKIEKVKQMLAGTPVRILEPCGLYYDNPRTVPQNKLRSKAGVLVKDIVSAKPPLEIVTIPKRQVAVGTIKANPGLVGVKVYPKLKEWLWQKGFQGGTPALEIYHKNGTVECQIPIVPAAADSAFPR
jgi:DNA gyrase inhibitor GyrI